MKAPRLFALTLIFVVGSVFVAEAGGEQAASSSVLNVDYRKLVSRADLIYETPVSRSEEGLPVGNGRMGSLVWTSPTALRLQINRVDVYANNRDTNSFVKRHTDYCSGIGFVDVDFVDFGEHVFPQQRTVQRLHVYDGLVTVEGKGVAARILAWHEQDVMAVEITDQRKQPAPISVSLRMLRPPLVETRNHSALSTLAVREGRIVLSQQFKEGDYYNGSALIIGVMGRKTQTKRANETELRLIAEPGEGPFTILIASAASFDSAQDVVASARDQLEAAAANRFDGLLALNQAWWHDYWSKAFIHLHSTDGVADFIEANYAYFLYVMASTSRGKFPPKFNGMIWSTGGDVRQWGAQHWWHNVSCYYRVIPPTNRVELMDPMFDMYSGMHDACALAAQQQWGSKGVFIPETVWFDGLEKLPDEIAEEMRELYLLRKPWEARSLRFREFAETKHPHSSRWNWKASGRWVDGRWTYPDKGAGPYGEVVHIFSSGAKIAYLYWQRYEYTMDEDWLRERAYPMLKGIAEFYRNHPNVKKGPDGKYHIHNVNNHEPIKGGQDALEEVAATRGILPIVIKASEILNVDEGMRPVWRDFLDNLPPLPTNDHPNSPEPRGPGRPLLWVNVLRPVLQGDPTVRSHHTIVPAIHYDLCTLEGEDPELIKVANASFESLFPGGINPQVKINLLDRVPIAAAVLGRAADIKILIPSQLGAWERDETVVPGRSGRSVLRNRMSLQEGPQANDVERIGRASDALQLALLQSVPSAPGKDAVIRVFPAWSRDWDAQYTLLARGGFLVSSSMRKGHIEFVELRSQAARECRLRNPWAPAVVALYRNSRKAQELNGSLLKFKMVKGEQVLVVPAGASPSKLRRVIPSAQ